MYISMAKSPRRPGQTQIKPVRPHTKVAVGEPDRQTGGVGGTVGEAVEVDVVVSQPLHFGEAHAITPFRGAAGAPGLEDGYAPAGGNMPQLSLRPGARVLPGGLDQCEALVHTPLLEGPVGLFLGEPVPLHEQGLGTSDEILL